MPELTGVWQLSPLAALVGAVLTMYLLIAYGKLIPRSSHERELASERRRADEWKQTADTWQEVARELRVQNGALIEAGRTSSHFFSQVPVKEETGHVDTA